MTAHNLVMNKPVKAYKGIPMEGIIAKWYAKNGARVNEQKWLARALKVVLPAGGNVLEVAPGPGFLSIELAGCKAYKVTALEISKTFIEIARDNARKANVNVEFRQGNASEMPFEDKTFDLIICVAAFKNFSRPLEAIREMCRVLKPNGAVCIVDLRRDVPLAEIDEHIKGDLRLSGINAWFTKLAFRYFLLKNAYTESEIQGLAAQTNFGQAKISKDTLGMQIWLEK